MLFATLMLAMLGINILFYCFSPQYVTYGSQHYIDANATLANRTIAVCSAEALESMYCRKTRQKIDIDIDLRWVHYDSSQLFVGSLLL